MDTIIVHDNTQDPVTATVGQFVSVGFSFTASSVPGYGLSTVELGLYNTGAAMYGKFGNVSVSLFAGYAHTGDNGGTYYNGDNYFQYGSSLAELGFRYDGDLPSSPGSLTAFSPASPLLLQPGGQYVIVVTFSFYSSSVLEFSSSVAGMDIVGEAYNDSLIARSYGRGPTSPTGSYIARVTEAPSTDTAALNATAVCYAAGTQILTARGEVAIEDLRAGDLLFSPRTLSFVPMLWIGRQRIRDPTHRAVRVAAGALGPGKPHTDLTVSPNHSLFLDGLLVPAFALVNGATVTWEPRPSIDYHHIECAAHDLVLANGAPSETWLDYGNRDAFDNADTGVVPLRRPLNEAIAADLPGHCAPCVQHGPAVGTIRRTLRTRAVALGCTLSGDADVHVVADGVRLDPSWAASVATFKVPPTARTLHLVSRTVRVQDLVDTEDTRTVGVAVGRIWASGRQVGLDTLEGKPGWWDQEAGEVPYRWTHGTATLPCGSRTLRIEVLRQLEYLVRPERQATTAQAVA